LVADYHQDGSLTNPNTNSTAQWFSSLMCLTRLDNYTYKQQSGTDEFDESVSNEMPVRLPAEIVSKRQRWL